MSRTRVRWGRVLVIVLVAAFLAGFLAGRAGAGSEAPKAPIRYVVRPGDTVWALAVGVAGPREDPRPIVNVLIQTNHIEAGRIIPGQVLVVPR